MGRWHSDAPGVPAPQAETRPFPQEYAPAYPYAQSPAASVYPVYPVLPLAPLQKPGGATPRYRPIRLRKRHRSPVPGLVGLCLMLVQLTLLARVICMLFGVAATTLWLGLLFVASDVFVEPLRWLATTINIAPLAGTQLLIYLEFLLAVIAYGLFSRLLVGLLKALLRP
ncbi:MAG: hypothetical protein ABI234_00765 [Ktedonobacteraceae bacterium]